MMSKHADKNRDSSKEASNNEHREEGEAVSPEESDDVKHNQAEETGSLSGAQEKDLQDQESELPDSEPPGKIGDLPSGLSEMARHSTGGMNASVASSPRESHSVDFMGSRTVHPIQTQLDRALEREREGDICQRQGDLQGALSAYRDVLSIIERLAPQNGVSADFHRNLSRNLAVWLYKLATTSEQLGSNREAIRYWKRCHETLQHMKQEGMDLDSPLQDLLSQLDDVQPAALEQLIDLNKQAEQHHEQGRLEEALQTYKECLTIRQDLVKKDPDNAERQRDLSVSHENVGNVLGELGDLDGALAAYEAALAIAEQLVDQDPQTAQWQRDLAVSYYTLATTLAETGDHQDASVYWNRCYATLRHMQQTDMPLDSPLRDLLTQLDAVQQLIGLNTQVERYHEQGRFDRALESAEHAYDFLGSISNWGWPACAECLNNLGALYTQVGQYAESQTLLSQAIDVWQAILHDKSHTSYAESLQNMAFLYYKAGYPAEAEPLYRQALLAMKAARGDTHPDVLSLEKVLERLQQVLNRSLDGLSEAGAS